MAVNAQTHFLEKVAGFPFFPQCFLFNLYKPLCMEEGQKIRRRGALLCYSSLAPPFTFNLFDGGLSKAELGSGRGSKYVSQGWFNLTRGKESAIKDTIHLLSLIGRFFARKFEIKFYPLVRCCNMYGTSGNIEVLHLLSSTDKQEYSKRHNLVPRAFPIPAPPNFNGKSPGNEVAKRHWFSLAKGKWERAEGVGLKKSLPLNEEMRWKNHVSHFNKKDLARALGESLLHFLPH